MKKLHYFADNKKVQLFLLLYNKLATLFGRTANILNFLGWNWKIPTGLSEKNDGQEVIDKYFEVTYNIFNKGAGGWLHFTQSSEIVS